MINTRADTDLLKSSLVSSLNLTPLLRAKYWASSMKQSTGRLL
jgi:hypothetical protein